MFMFFYLKKDIKWGKQTRSKGAEAVIDNPFTITWQNQVETLSENVAARRAELVWPSNAEVIFSKPPSMFTPCRPTHTSKELQGFKLISDPGPKCRRVSVRRLSGRSSGGRKHDMWITIYSRRDLWPHQTGLFIETDSEQ